MALTTRSWIAVATLMLAGCGGGGATSDGGNGGTSGGSSGASGSGVAGAGGGASGTGPGGASGTGTAGTGGVAGGAAGTTGIAGMGGGGGIGGGAGGMSGASGAAGRGGAGGVGGSAGRGGAGGTAGGGTGGATGRGGGGGGAGTGVCGNTGMNCTAAQFCNWLDNRCGQSGELASGACMARSTGCTTEYGPVCGCDGQIYSNECVAYAAGQDLLEINNCPPPTGMFACGPRFCAHGTQYCQAVIAGPAGAPGTYSCNQLPAGCLSNPTCACLGGIATCGGNCRMSGSGDLTATCYAP